MSILSPSCIRSSQVTDATIDRSALNISAKISDGVRRCADGAAGSSVSAKMVGHVVNYTREQLSI